MGPHRTVPTLFFPSRVAKSGRLQNQVCKASCLQDPSAGKPITVQRNHFRLRFMYESKRVTCVTLAQQLKNENLCKLIGSKLSSISGSILHSGRLSQVKVILLSSDGEIETT